MVEGHAQTMETDPLEFMPNPKAPPPPPMLPDAARKPRPARVFVGLPGEASEQVAHHSATAVVCDGSPLKPQVPVGEGLGDFNVLERRSTEIELPPQKKGYHLVWVPAQRKYLSRI